MPRALTLQRFLQIVDTDTLLHAGLSRHGRKLAALLAFWRARTYAEYAAVQQRRLDRGDQQFKRAVARAFGGQRRPKRLPSFFGDVHFYLICWNIVSQQLNAVYNETRFPLVKAALRPHRRILADYTEMRDHLEHFDERTNGKGGKGQPLKAPGDLGNGSRNLFSFGGKTIDTSRKSLSRLKQIVMTVEMALKLSVWEDFKTHDPKAAQRLVDNLYRDRHIRRTLLKLGLTAKQRNSEATTS